MKDYIRGILSGIMAAAVLITAVPLTGCGKKERTKFNELIEVAADRPWYTATVKTIDPVIDPNDYMWHRSNTIGMIDDKIINWVSGAKMWDIDHEATADTYTNIISVYDSNAEHVFDKELSEAVKEYVPGAEEVMIQNVYIKQDMVKFQATWIEGGNVKYKEVTFDTSEQKVVSSEDMVSKGDYDLKDSYSVNFWTADGYSINSFYAIFEQTGMLYDRNYLEFTLPSGEEKLICLEDTFSSDDILQVYDFLYLENGRFCFKYEGLSVEKNLCYIDINSGKVSDISSVAEFSWLADLRSAWDYSYFEGVGNAIIDQHGVKKLDLNDHSETVYFSYDDCDINRFDTANLDLLKATDDKIILAGVSRREQFGNYSVKDIHEDDNLIVILQKAPSNPNVGKKILKAAGFEPISYSMAEAIRQFNNTNPEAFIMLDPRYDYEEVAKTILMADNLDETTFDLQVKAAMMNKLTMDLLAAEGPDLILGTMNYTYLNNEDLLLDLSGDVNVPNVYNNIINSAKTGKALYQVPLAFGLEGILVDKSDVDTDKPGFTFESYREYISGPCNGKDPNMMDRLDFMSTCISEASSAFRDGENLDFDNKEFSKTAEFVNDLVLPTEQEIMDQKLMLRTSTMGQESAFVNISSGMEFLRVTGNNVEEMTMMGFPSYKARGLMINVSQSVGVSAATSCPDACREFIKLLLSDDIQYLFARYDGISINSNAQADACRIFAERTNACYKAMSGNYDQYMLTILKTFTTTVDADLLISQMDGYIKSASGLRIIDAEIDIIIREEIQAYFAGQKSIKDVMKTIQNRVGVYESERG